MSINLEPWTSTVGDTLIFLRLQPEAILTSISSTEFLKMMTTETKGVDFEQEMRSAFKVFDVDGSGTISPEEIYKLMASLGENLSEEEIKSMVKEVDKNGDGSIDCKMRTLFAPFEQIC
jgi:Ca2+-binding EF-hand superfamily protein